jgi:hypothetical protein
MLDKKALNKSASQAFRAQMRDEVEWLAKSCWPQHIQLRLEKINAIFAAAKQLELEIAGNITPFTKEEVEEMVRDLTPLRTLEMAQEAREYLVAAIARKGFDLAFFDDAEIESNI